MAIGEQEHQLIEFVNWHDLYNRIDGDDDAIIEGLAYPGRWTAIASPAKAGKSTVILALAVEASMNGHTTVYIDAEMGRVDVLDRVDDWMDLKPDDLNNFHYTDLPPKLDNVQGATALWHTIEKINPTLVIIDGINGVVNGAENDDIPWRDMYEWAIMPLKQRGIAIISLDNTGHGTRKGPRGSSVKLDKADAVIVLERTDTGAKLTTTHRRTATYPLEQEYTVTDAEAGGRPMSVTRTNEHQAPAGTKQICAILDDLGVPLDAGKRTARKALKEHGHETPRDTELLLMLKWRRGNSLTFNPQPKVVPNHPGTTGNHPPVGGSQVGNHPPKTPGHRVVPDGSLLREPPSATGSENPGTTTLEADYEDPFA